MSGDKDIDLNDSYRQQGLRKTLVEKVKAKGIGTKKIWQALLAVPRHVFVDNMLDEHLYADKAFPIESGQTISQPSTVAYQTEMLNLKPNEIVLEIGTGSGYQAAILHEMGVYVFTIERHKPLYQRATQILKALGCKNVKTFFGDGYKGLPTYAPYDKILVTAAAPEIPQALLDQLKVGGRLIIPVGKGKTQDMLCIDKVAEDEFKKTKGGKFAFVPMLKGKVRD